MITRQTLKSNLQQNCFDLRYLGFGLGLRYPHFTHVLENRPREAAWFEIISEDFMDAHPGYWDMLADLRKDYPFAMHGVSLSLGSPEPLNRNYLTRLKKLADFLNPEWVSDHICWTGIHGINTHDLLPVPYTEDALQHFAQRVREVQDFLERPLLLENPSSYLGFAASTMSEWEFVARLAEESNSAILLDVNNVFVSAFNHRYDAQAYINALPAERVVQIHLAGHRHLDTHIVDTHDDHVTDAVWELYRYTIKRMGQKTTMIEWDSNIPEFPVLLAELDKAKNHV